MSDLLTLLDIGIGALCLWKLMGVEQRVETIEAFILDEKPIPPDAGVKPSVPRTRSRENVHHIHGKKRAKTQS